MKARALLVPLLAAAAAAACDGVVPDFFRPASGTSPDRTPPRFADPSPAPEVVVVNTSAFTIDVTDPAGEGTAASGIAPGGVTATRLGAGPLPVTYTAPRVTIDVSGVPDGAFQVGVNAEDRAGNNALYLFSNVLDTTPPDLSFPSPGPPATRQSSASTLTIPVRVSATDAHFGSATVTARTPGPDGTCGTADDGTIPPEILPDPDGTFTESGTATVQFVFDNPVPNGGTPRTDAYCWVVTAVDTALAPDGSPAGNAATLAARTDVTWGPPP